MGMLNAWFHIELLVFSQQVNTAYYDNAVNKSEKREVVNKYFNMHE